MKYSPFSRLTFGGALVVAFLGGLILASGLDLTQSGHAQARSTSAATTIAPIVPASVTELSAAFTSIAETATPAVVSIRAERTQTEARQRRDNQQPPMTFEDFFSPGQRQPQQASGSGFIVSNDGYILTNNHVIQGFDRVEVSLTDRRTFKARVIGRDETTDVAVIKIDEKGLPFLRLGDDNAARVGEFVIAIGNPLGLDFTVTQGIVSAKGRGRTDVRVNNNNWAITDFIQTDAAINPGNSGGPLVNVRGEVIGINTAIASQTGMYAGYGFAIPITLAKEVLDDFIEHGRVRRAVLGISINDARAEDAAVAGMKEITGVLVEPYNADNADSPAKRAGIEAGDVIIRADGKPADRVSTLQRIIRTHEPGDVVAIDVMRFGQRKSFNVRLGEASDSTMRVASNVRPDRDAGGRGTVSEKLGITVEPITEEQATRARLADEYRGLRVVEVDPNGPARDRIGQNEVVVSVITSSGRKPLRTTADLQQMLRSTSDGSYVSLVVYNVDGGQSRIVNLKVGG